MPAILADGGSDPTSLPFAIVCVDRNGTVQTWNAEAERIFGFSKTDMIGKSVALIIPTAFRENHWKGFHRFVRTGVSTLPEKVVTQAVGRGGEPIRIATSVQALRDENGRISGVEATMSLA